MKVTKKICVLGFSILSACGAQKASNSGVHAVRDQGAEDALGAGYDVVAEDRKGDCVSVTPLESQPGLGQQVVFVFTKITSNDELHKIMNISPSAFLKAGTNKASGKVKFAESIMFNSYSTYYLLNVQVSNDSREMRNVELTADARGAYLQSPERFRQMCGDEFVSGFVPGGEYSAVLKIGSKNSTEKKDIEEGQTKFKNNFLEGKDKFQASIDEISKKHSVEIVSFEGGQGPFGITAQQMVEESVNFPKKVSGDKNSIHQILTQKYSNLFLPLGKTLVNPVEGEIVVDKLAQQRMINLDTLNNIVFIEENPEQFEAIQAGELDKIKGEVVGNLEKISEASRICFIDHTKCSVPVLVIPSSSLPKRKAADQMASK